MARNRYFIAAGLFGLFTTGVHLVAGQVGIVEPMLAATFDPTAKYTMLACWHLVSADLALTTAAFLAAGWRPDTYAVNGVLPAFAMAHWVLWTVVFLSVAAVADMPGAFVALPQPVLFVPVIAAALLGLRMGTRVEA